jgi:hypothetical protein
VHGACVDLADRRTAPDTSEVKIPAPSPKGVPLACAIALSQSSARPLAAGCHVPPISMSILEHQPVSGLKRRPDRDFPVGAGPI